MAYLVLLFIFFARRKGDITRTKKPRSENPSISWMKGSPLHFPYLFEGRKLNGRGIK